MQAKQQQGFKWDTSNFSGIHDLFQVLDNKCRRITFEGAKVRDVDWSWNLDNFTARNYGGILHQETPESIREKGLE